MRISVLLFATGIIFANLSAVVGQTPELIEAARQVAVPVLPDSAEAASSRRMPADTTALGCQLIPGLPLPDPIEVHRLEFPLRGSDYAVHISADGSLVQPCDERFPNLGAGTQPVRRDGADSDGDGFADTDDSCPLIVGIASADRPGCPQASAADRDGDGSPDRLDRCPNQAGVGATDGCAILTDEDGDGAPDHIDICRAHFGVIRPDFAIGCPADGSGASIRRRAPDDICQVIGADIPVLTSRDELADITKREDSATVIGRTAAMDWYQVEDGWVKSADAKLKGACYNIPLVNPALGGATDCYARTRGNEVNVREAPNGRLVAHLLAHEQQAVLGMNITGDWLFFRAGWVSRSVLELAGTCERLPLLDPSRVASGTIRFCPPGYADLLTPRIGIGEANARVASTTLANRLRAEPDYRAEQIGEIPPGSIIDAVLDGPACQAPFIWWQVKVDGQVGWTVESDINAYHYYLEPVGASEVNASSRDKLTLSETAQPASNRLIHSANLDYINTVAALETRAPIAVSWSPRQRLLAAITEIGEIALFSAPGFQPIGADLTLPAPASAIAFSPDESWLAVGSSDGGVALIELMPAWSVGQTIELGEQAGPVRALSWNRAGDKLAAVSGAEALKLARQAGTLKVWQIDASAPEPSALALHYRYPYPLTDVAFSRDGRWLAVSGESSVDRRAALWVYDGETGELALSKPLVPMRGYGLVIASPFADLGDFVYSSGDSLYQLRIDSSDVHRFYHRAGEVITGVAFRPQVIPGAEALMALTAETRSVTAQIRFANALNPHAPTVAFSQGSSAIAFSPDGRLLASAEPKEDRIRLIGVTADG